ncbi:MAG: hypothetical protein QGD91_09900 [Actinomycetota bacterium]|nr:hypothetical protein [Actinomycetota bacterium]
MQLQFTEHFDEEYIALHTRDIAAVDAMLDSLEDEHEKPHMRNVIKIGSMALFATPRFEAPSGTYRITWKYDNAQQPTIIVCITVAKAEVRRPV